MYNKNAAYDLSLFEEKPQKNNLVRLNVKKIRRIRALKAKLAVIFSGLLICMGVSLGMAMFISGQAKLAEYTEEITQLNKQYCENESIVTQLNMKKKAEICKEEVESRIKTEFEIDEGGSVEYINVMNDSKGEIKESSDILHNISNGIFNFCNNFFSI